VKTVALQILVLIAAAFLAGFTSNSVRQTLQWRGNDPTFLKHDIVGVTRRKRRSCRTIRRRCFSTFVRPAEFAVSHIPGAASFPADDPDAVYGELRDFLGTGMKALVYGDNSMQAVRAAEYLEERGHVVRALEGGWSAWQKRQLPVEAGTP
jgi:rhodanese-related sulfurtransferase